MDGTHNGVGSTKSGCQTELPDVLLDAARTVASDLASVENNAGGVAVDAVGLVAAGLRLADGDGVHDEPGGRHLVPARLWHADAARRAERADALRTLASLLEGDVPPTAADLIDAMPPAWTRRHLERSAEDVLRRRCDAAEAASGLSRKDFQRRNAALLAGASPYAINRLFNRLWNAAVSLWFWKK